MKPFLHETSSNFYCGIILICLIVFTATIDHASAGNTGYDTASWSRVLEKYVDGRGYVDYQGLNTDRDDLDRYLNTISKSGPQSNPEYFPTTQHQLAYYLNAYNALVFQGVLSRGPEQTSVWSGLISGLKFFVRMKVRLDGETTNLRDLENDIIRDRFKDPRIHSALNCASISCPRLIREPFSANILDSQLDDAMEEFVSNSSNIAVDRSSRTVFLSEIFDWFEEDFINYEKSQGNIDPRLLDYINRFRNSSDRIDRDYSIRFLEYDKGINSQ
jgi:hypothetical protein